MHEDHNGDGQQPGAWEAWTPQADQPIVSDVSAPSPAEPQPREGNAEPGEWAQTSPGESAQTPSADEPAQTTQEFQLAEPAQDGDAAHPGQLGGYPPPGQPAGAGFGPAYGQPGDARQPGYGQAGYGQPGDARQEPGYGQPGDPLQQPGYAQPGGTLPGYGQPGYGPPPGYQAGGGFGQPPGGQGPPPGYGPTGGHGLPPGYGQPPRRRSGLTTAVAYIAVAAVAASIGGLAVGLSDSGNQQPPASSGTFSNPNFGGQQSNGGPGSSDSVSPAALHKVTQAVSPSLVVISSSLRYQGAGSSAAATGMIISSRGMVLTNNHVINQTTGLTATIPGTGQHFNAKWLGYDKGSDVAVIQLEHASGLKTVPLGNSDTVKVGDPVVGLGNAGGTGSIHAVPGTVTALNQSITASDQGSGVSPERLTGMLQTDAQIIPGDSGGPLANLSGQVIGMDTAASTSGVFSGQQSQQDVGFAIPINRAMAIAKQIISGRSSPSVQVGPSGFVGVLVPGGKNGAQSTLTNPQAQLRDQEKAAAATNLPLPPATNRCLASNQQAGIPGHVAPIRVGTLVLGSLCGTPAAKVGLVPGDVITRVNSHPVSSPASLMAILHTIKGGSTVKLTWVTPGGQTEIKPMTLAKAPPA